MAQESKKGFAVISDIKADTVVAAISDRNYIQVCILGETRELLEAYKYLVSAFAGTLASNVVEEKRDRAEEIVLKAITDMTIKGIASYFLDAEEEEE